MSMYLLISSLNFIVQSCFTVFIAWETSFHLNKTKMAHRLEGFLGNKIWILKVKPTNIIYMTCSHINSD